MQLERKYSAASSGMQLVKTYSVGERVRRCITPEGQMFWYPVTEAHQLWHDLPGNSGTLPVASQRLSCWHCPGCDTLWVHSQFAGARPERILLESGASTCFLSTAVAQQCGQHLRPCQQYITLPDGPDETVTGAKGRIDVNLKIAGCHTAALRFTQAQQVQP